MEHHADEFIDLLEEGQGLEQQVDRLHYKLERANQQLVLVANLIESTTIRYTRAVSTENRIFRYTLRMKIATYEGVRCVIAQISAAIKLDILSLEARMAEVSHRIEALVHHILNLS